MKTQLEEIQPDNDSSFHIMVNPRLNDFFFWHFHPEFELVFIDGASGTRHVGEHISRYEDSDLVFIGSNIPHLNFDYGVKTDYEKTVLHIHPNFLKEAFYNTPELSSIHQLFEKSRHGIAFGTEAKILVGERMKRLHLLPKFEQFLEILQLFQILANVSDIELLHQQPVENQHNRKEEERLKTIYQFIDDNFQHKIEIERLSELSRLSKPAFCRYFKKMTRLTFTEFLGHYRVNQAKKLLRLDKNVTETCFECGFESLSYFNRTFKKVTGENPMSFKKRYQ
jgi:AraC-like DNA-binding protein